jgi:hypothetical protein
MRVGMRKGTHSRIPIFIERNVYLAIQPVWNSLLEQVPPRIIPHPSTAASPPSRG